MASRLAYPENRPKFCQWPDGCDVKALYQIGYQGRWISVCGQHDRAAGGLNLVAVGFTPVEANSWMRNPY